MQVLLTRYESFGCFKTYLYGFVSLLLSVSMHSIPEEVELWLEKYPAGKRIRRKDPFDVSWKLLKKTHTHIKTLKNIISLAAIEK